MKKKQGVLGTDIDMILSKSFNLLSVFFDNVYMPTYTNGLKDIAQYLGFQWSDKNASGIQSIVWRTRWEMTGGRRISRQANSVQQGRLLCPIEG